MLNVRDMEHLPVKSERVYVLDMHGSRGNQEIGSCTADASPVEASVLSLLRNLVHSLSRTFLAALILAVRKADPPLSG